MKTWIMGVILLFSMLQGIGAEKREVRGKVYSARDKEPLGYVHILLQTPDSVFVTGTMTDEAGHYHIPNIEAGDFLLQVSCLGFKSYYLPIEGLAEDRTIQDILLEEDAVALKDITVSASNLTNKSDRKLVYPNERQLKASTNGVNLLQQLMLPRVQVNPLFNEVSLPGGGELQFRINGVKVELQDIIALLPADVIRVEYHDNPGLRYGNAEIVLDYIVYRPETGGSFGVDLNDAVASAWGNNLVNGRFNHKKSEFAVNYGIYHRDFYTMYRDNDEQFSFADGTTLHRKEEGDPGHGQLLWQNLNATYSLLPSSESMFNATIRYYGSNSPHWDYKGSLYNVANPADKVNMIDQTANKTHRPAIDLYYQQGLKNDQTLVFNVVGTYNYTDVTRKYSEQREENMLTDILNVVEGNKYSIIGEGIYEKKLGVNRISGGVRHSHHFSDNTYKNGQNYTTNMTQAQTYAYAEFKGKVKQLDYTLGISATRDWFNQKGEDKGYADYTFNPRVVLHYTLPDNSFFRLQGEVGNHSPSLSELSNVEQMIDSIQIQRGNPNLKPYRRYNGSLTYEKQKGVFYLSWRNYYEYRPKAVMDEKRWEENKIVQTWDNQKSWQQLSSQITFRAGPLKEFFQINASGGVNYYNSHGNHYRHEYTNWFGRVYADIMYKKWFLIFGLETNWNWFYGEKMSGGENIHFVTLKYKHKNLTLSAGMFNPFVNNYKQESADWSEYASYHRSNYVKESSRLFVAQLSYNFSFGRAFNSGQKRINNRDDDSGVMSTGK